MLLASEPASLRIRMSAHWLSGLGDKFTLALQIKAKKQNSLTSQHRTRMLRVHRLLCSVPQIWFCLVRSPAWFPRSSETLYTIQISNRVEPSM